PEAVVLLHGLAEDSRAWYGWVPELATQFRVVRPDFRGFGRSTVPGPGHTWSISEFASDLHACLGQLQFGAVHLVGAKLGGAVALEYAATWPSEVRSVAVTSGTPKGAGNSMLSQAGSRIAKLGLRGWAAETQRARLGSDASDDQLAYWTKYMAETDGRVFA